MEKKRMIMFDLRAQSKTMTIRWWTIKYIPEDRGSSAPCEATGLVRSLKQHQPYRSFGLHNELADDVLPRGLHPPHYRVCSDHQTQDSTYRNK